MNLELDQFRDVDLVIDYANYTFIEKQVVSQGDYKGRTLTVQVTNKGVVGEVPGLTLNLNWHNEASGLTDLSAFSVLDKSTSKFRIEFPQHMMTPGRVIASIQVIQNGKVTNLKQFELTVQRLAGQAVGIVEKAEFSALVAVLADANQFRTDIESLEIIKADKTQVASKAEKTYVDSMLTSIAQGGPRELFYSLAALKAKYPNGADGTYLVFDSTTTDGAHSYMWDKTASVWKDLGIYQGVKIASGSVANEAITNDGLRMDSTNFAEGYYAFTANEMIKGVWLPTDGTALIDFPRARVIFLKTAKGKKYTITKSKVTDAFVIGASSGKSAGSSAERIYSNALITEVTITNTTDYPYLYIAVSNNEATCDVTIKEESIKIAGRKVNETGFGILISENPIEIDWVNKLLKINASARLSQGTKDIQLANSSGLTIDFSGVASKNVVYFFYDLDTLTVSCKGYNDAFPMNAILFAIVRIAGEQIWTTAKIKKAEETISIASNRIIFPETLYMIEDESYPVILNNIIYDKYEDTIVYGEVSDLQGSKQFQKSFLLENKYAAELDSKIVVKVKGDNSILRKDFKMKTINPAALNGKQVKVLMIGDSTTQTNMPATVKWWLSQWGVESTMIGTTLNKRDQFGFGMPLTGEKGEGRGGWRLAEMLNDAYLSDGNRFYPPGNPFLNASNVWDFEHYMTTNNFDGVDVVHFQMGTNDILPYSVFKSEMGYDVALESFEDSLSKLPGRLRGMISSIHAYDSSIKIAINPPMVAGLDETFNQKAIRYAETEFFALKEHENVFVLPSYVGIGNLSVAGGYIGSGSEVSSINSSKVDTISNNVHPDGMGQLSNALWVASWIAHQIA